MIKQNVIKKSSRSVELRWLSRHNKNITLPELVMCDKVYLCGDEVGGFMTQSSPNEMLINDRYYDLTNGLMVVGTDGLTDSEIQETISHEWRHHVQNYYGLVEPNYKSWYIKPEETYRDAIIRYFTTSMNEMDALLYSLHKAPSDTNKLWYQWLVNSGDINHIKSFG